MGRIRRMLGLGDPRPGEDDVTRDDGQSLSRATGGVAEPGASDQGSTTGATESEGYVGRVQGQDVGYEGETGAERRARWEQESARASED